MNRNSILHTLLSLAVVVLFILHFSNNSTKNEATTTNREGISSTSPSGLYYIDEEKLLSNYEEFMNKRKVIELEQEKAEKELERQGRQFQQEYENFQRRAQSGAYSPKQMQTMQEDLEKKQNQLLLEQQIKSEEIMKMTRDLNKELEEKLDAILMELQKELNADFIFAYSRQSNILSVSEKFDITEKVLDLLNKK
jgi:outer membrane protein